DRISNTTTFNSVNLLSAGTTVSLQIGLDGSSESRISFTTVDGSSSGIGLATVGSRRGSLGSIESRLNTAIANLRVARENFSAAESRIRDADVAEETATLTRTTILQQAGISVLAQANQQPSLALSLLR